ncbi:hypothetical protein KKG29_04660 [Patescibacteria group bacterium]|nr:hypothetical protein [Patescibacteria group bacterium]
MNGSEYDDAEENEEKRGSQPREEVRRLVIEALKRKKIAEAKEMLKRQMRIAVLKRRQTQLALKKKIAAKALQKTKLVAQVARQVVMFALRIVAAVIASFGFYILIALLIILIIVLVVAGVYYLCNETLLGEAVCWVFK